MIDDFQKQVGISEEKLKNLYSHPNFKKTIELLEKKNSRFKDLPEEIKRLAMAMFLQGDLNKVSSMWKLFYRRPIPTIEEFLSKEYLGSNSSFYVDESPWTQDLKYIFNPTSNILEWAMSGAIGTAKTSVACISQFYNLYRINSLREPSLAMGEGKTKPMVLMLLTVTKDKAGELFQTMLNTIQECQYYIEVKHKDQFREFINQEYCQYVPYLVHKVEGFDRITFPNNVYIRTGSQKSHTIGSNLFGGIMDEAEFRGGAKKAEEAYDLYSEVLQRVTSRFINSHYKLVNLVSSVKHDTGIMTKHIENLKNEKELGRSYVSSYSQWDVKKEYFGAFEKYGHFYALAGNMSHPSRVLNEEEQIRFENNEFILPDQCKVIQVPKHPDLYVPFLRNPDRALRDSAGIVTSGGERPFDNFSQLVDPLLSSEITLISDISKEGSLFDKLPKNWFQKTPMGLKLKRFPNSKRYVHLDLAETGEAGISMVHKEIRSDGTIMYINDFIIKIVSPTRISQTLIEEFLVDLKEVGNIFIEILSADQYQSTYMRERLENLHKVAKIVKKLPLGGKTNIEPFLTCANLIAEGLVKSGECKELKEQLKGIYIHNDTLQHDTNRKDLADAFIGSLYSALNHSSDIPTNIYENYVKINQFLDLSKIEGIKPL